jgi:hypothetical protein
VHLHRDSRPGTPGAAEFRGTERRFKNTEPTPGRQAAGRVGRNLAPAAGLAGRGLATARPPEEVDAMLYILAWLLGVPATILILIWLLNHG